MRLDTLGELRCGEVQATARSIVGENRDLGRGR